MSIANKNILGNIFTYLPNAMQLKMQQLSRKVYNQIMPQATNMMPIYSPLQVDGNLIESVDTTWLEYDSQQDSCIFYLGPIKKSDTVLAIGCKDKLAILTVSED